MTTHTHLIRLHCLILIYVLNRTQKILCRQQYLQESSAKPGRKERVPEFWSPTTGRHGIATVCQQSTSVTNRVTNLVPRRGVSIIICTIALARSLG